MPAVDRNVRHSAFTAPVKSDYLMLEAFQEAVRDMQRAARNVAGKAVEVFNRHVELVAARVSHYYVIARPSLQRNLIYSSSVWLSCERLSIRSVP